MNIGDATDASIEPDHSQGPEGALCLKQSEADVMGYIPETVFAIVCPLYGLSDAPFLWWQQLSQFLVGRRVGARSDGRIPLPSL